MSVLSDPNTYPRPDAGWTREIAVLKDALVVPPEKSGTVQTCGVYDRDGSWCGHGATWRGTKRMTDPVDEPPKAVEKLAGRHLFAGQIWAHFGHWMCESMARFWAYDHTEKPDSLLYIVKRPQRQATVHGFQQSFLDLLGIDIPITILREPTEVEELIVPGQGFGLGPIIEGTPEFHDFMWKRLRQGPRPDGARKLYISRSALGGSMGGIILEDLLEKNLEANGYRIYHPQKHSLAEQVEAYRAADLILGADGSAFHLVGFVATPEQKIGVVFRRNSNVARGLLHHIGGFTGRPADEINTLATDWVPVGGGRANRNSFGQLDFEVLKERLVELGYLDADAPWEVPSWRQQKTAALAIGKRRGLELVSMRQRQREARLARLAAERAARDAEGEGEAET